MTPLQATAEPAEHENISQLAELLTTMRAVGRVLSRGGSDSGHWAVSYEIHDGEIRNIRTTHGPITNIELAETSG